VGANHALQQTVTWRFGAPRRTSRAAARVVVVVLTLLLLAGCGGGEEPGGTPAATTEPGPAAETHVTAYFLRGETVAPAGRTVARTEAPARAAVEELLAGPSGTERGFGLGSSIPEGTELLGIAIADGVATVDLSRTFESGGGSLSMTTRLAQLVFTLTRFDSVEAVDLHLDGADVESIGGEGVAVDPPLRRSDFADATPVVLVDSPALGDAVSSPLRVEGSALVFEGVVLVTVTDAEGRVLAEETTIADEGAPARGDFRVAIDLDVPAAQAGTVVAAAPNARGGPPQHVFEVPVRLEPR
jgi:hypothetical protein